MGPHAGIFGDREVQYPAAIHANALAYERVGRLAVARTLILDPIVYATCQGLVLRHTPLASIIHSVIIPLARSGLLSATSSWTRSWRHPSSVVWSSGGPQRHLVGSAGMALPPSGH